MIEQTFGDRETAAAKTLIELALAEDLSTQGDLTCQALIPADRRATVNIVARANGVVSGSPIGRMVFEKLDRTIQWQAKRLDGDHVAKDDIIAKVSGPLRSLLIGERTMLNFMTHLSGIATTTRRFVDAVAGTGVKVLDTRKTLPGWRFIQKYAVRCGGGSNHRMGLYDGILIKDNHLAAWTETSRISEAVRKARTSGPAGICVEVEVDTLQQLEDALEGAPDIVLLDNMRVELLKTAAETRNRLAPKVLLEASGGVTLDTIPQIARTGVERISVGALTHSATALDLAFDWAESERQ